MGIEDGSLNTVVGSSAYPSLACGGELRLQAAAANKIELLEDITFGRNCVDLGTVALSLVPGGEVIYQWHVTRGGQTVAVGAITRAGRTIPFAPVAPSGLVVTAGPSGLMQLSWVDNSGNESGFAVERATENGPFEAVAVVGPDVIDHQDSGVLVGTRYTYRVRVFNSGGSSTSPSVSIVATSQSQS